MTLSISEHHHGKAFSSLVPSHSQLDQVPATSRAILSPPSRTAAPSLSWARALSMQYFLYRRIWQNQAEFQSAVLAAMASEEVTDQERVVMAAMTEFATTVDRSTVESRRAALHEIMRIAAEANLTKGTTSRGWATVIGVWALASGSRGSATADPISESIRASYAAVEGRGIAATEALLVFLGLRPRPPLDVRQFTVACTALVEGCALRDRADGGIRGIELATGPGGVMQAWTVLGIGMEALAEQFFEFDPDWSPDGTP